MDVDNEESEELFQDRRASSDAISNIAASDPTLEGGEYNENAKSKKEVITPSNSSKEGETMSSKVQTKIKATRKVPAKKKTAATASSKSKIQSKLKLKNEVDTSDLEGRSSDEKFLEEFESDSSDFSSSTDSDDISQEFSDEDRLMEYYEKKLREHAVVGNISYNSDFSEDSEPPQELKQLVEDTFQQKPSGKRDQVRESSTKSATKAARHGKRDHAGLSKASGKSLLTKYITTVQKSPITVRVDMKSVISGLNPVKGSRKEPVLTKLQVPKLSNLARKNPAKNVSHASSSLEDLRTHKTPEPTRNFRTPLDLTKPGSNQTGSQVVSSSSSTQLNSGRPEKPKFQPNSIVSEAGEDAASGRKVFDYLTRIKQVQNSITEISKKINVDADVAVDLEILKSTRAAILEQRDRNKKSSRVGQKRNGFPTSTSASSMASEGDSEYGVKELKDKVVDRILNATLGVS